LEYQKSVEEVAEIPPVSNMVPEDATTTSTNPTGTPLATPLPSLVRVTCPADMPIFKEGDDNVEEFLEEFESILAANHLSLETYWRTMLIGRMKGFHKKWANKVVQAELSWEQVKEKMIRELGDSRRRDRLTSQLHALRPKSGEQASS